MTTSENGVYGIKKEYIDTREINACELISQKIHSSILESKKKYKGIKIICIGTDRSTGDSFAPFLGSLLTESRQLESKCEIYGTLENPIHAKNMIEKLAMIDTKNSLVIAVDACLGKEEHLGYISISNGVLSPGKAMGKNLPKLGDITIAGNVNISGDYNFMTLQNTRLGNVYGMVKKLEIGLVDAINTLNVNNINLKVV